MTISRNALMPTETQRIHVSVVAMDIVSYSRELDDTQYRLVQLLTELVDHSLKAHKIDDCLKLPTGDGAILIFPHQPSSKALEVALDIRQQIRQRLIRLPVRMGIHEGPAWLMLDLNGQLNVVGNAVNMCARVMNLGDDEHILLSEGAYEGIKTDERFYRFVSPLASNPVQVKHGVALDVYAYSDALVGKATEPERLRKDVGVRATAVGRPPDAWREFLQAKTKLKVLDHSGPFFGIPQLLDRIVELVCKENVEVRILLLNPLSHACRVRSQAAAYKSIDELENTIGYTFRILRHLRRAIESSGSGALGRYDVRLFDAIPTFGAFITDDLAHISTYVEHLSGSRGPFFSFARHLKAFTGVKSMYDCFEEAFDSLWTCRSISIFASDFLEKQQRLLDNNKGDVSDTLPPYM